MFRLLQEMLPWLVLLTPHVIQLHFGCSNEEQKKKTYWSVFGFYRPLNRTGSSQEEEKELVVAL